MPTRHDARRLSQRGINSRKKAATRDIKKQQAARKQKKVTKARTARRGSVKP